MTISPDDEWHKKLTPEQYRILREKGTEAPFSGELLHNKDNGMYTCAGCGAELFSADTKFDSGTGWPSFYDVAKSDAVKLIEDTSHGLPSLGYGKASMTRTEVVCAKCGGHLGHVFDDLPAEVLTKAGGPVSKIGGKRYCINSGALGFCKK